MAQVTPGTARAAALIGFFILLCGIALTTCGIIWIAFGGYLGHGLWSGIPMLVVAILGFLSLTRHNLVFSLYVFLAVCTSIASGIQAVSGGLELRHWNRFMGDKKCSVKDGVCQCLGQEAIRIRDLDSCDKIPTINDIFICLIFFSIIGAILCLGGAIAGCVGLATVPRTTPTTIQRKPKKKPVIEVSYPPRTEPYQTEKIKMENGIERDQYDGGYRHDETADKNHGIKPRNIEVVDRRQDYMDRSRDPERGSDYYYKDNMSDRDSYYDKDRYDRDYYRDYDRDYYRDDKYYDRDSNYDYDRRSYDDRRTPPPDDKTYL